ncbi:MAG TPA: ribonuclease D, partial [Chromatiales bacterium]|nr:ribonuclease D [Chromatiales bacterium]
MQELYIDTQEGLTALCAELGDSRWLAVDTEFLRERTYYPQLCLVQVASEEIAACIDPLTIDDLSPLRDLLLNPDTLKVFHAARQDLEILFQLWEAVPAPVFDTQIAATLLGLGDQTGYANVVEQVLKVTLAKEHSRTDWTRRPLLEEQRRYALDDVIYLGRLYQEMHARLENLGRTHWLREDFNALVDPALYRIQPESMWQRIRGRQRL